MSSAALGLAEPPRIFMPGPDVSQSVRVCFALDYPLGGISPVLNNTCLGAVLFVKVHFFSSLLEAEAVATTEISSSHPLT